jgi:hypothetical protein
MSAELIGRLFHCGGCRGRVYVCQTCDSQHVYCVPCSVQAKRRRSRERSRRYQRTRRGRDQHVKRQRRYRERNSSGANFPASNVTHAPLTEESSCEMTEPLAVVVTVNAIEEPSHESKEIRCFRCNRPISQMFGYRPRRAQRAHDYRRRRPRLPTGPPKHRSP